MRTKLFTLLTILFFIVSINSVMALVEVVPKSKDLSIFSTFKYEVNVTISGVDDMYGFQFDFTYDPDVFEITGTSDISEGTFLNNNGAVTTSCIDADISTDGLINNYACTRYGSDTGTSGSGVIASVMFRLKSLTTFPDSSDINISSLKISDINSQSLDNSLQSGNVVVYECLYNGGTDPESKSCSSNNCQGTQECNSNNEWGDCSVSSNAETCDGLDNDCDGDIDEDLKRDCSGYSGICAIGTETCSDGEWSGCPTGTDEICDNGIDEDCDGNDPSCKGDITGNGNLPDNCVDIMDLTFIASMFGLKQGDSGYDDKADISPTDDNEIDIFDLVIIGKEFNQGSNC
ncbi:MAG: hypothetical protein KAS32_30690 [Candidatus Peribacteraceae bacterium]|nr:hypothetical protein [Candidatus Peribacteraceae bacterium]